LKFEQYKPLLLACLDIFLPNSSEEHRRVLKLLVAWGVRFLVTNQLGSSKLEAFYPDAASRVRTQQIVTAAALVRAVGDNIPSDAAFERDFTKFEEETNVTAKYFLSRLNDQLAADEGDEERVAGRALTLEHILPKSENAQGYNEFPRDSADLYRSRLGNQTLLLGRPNKSLGAGDFAVKREAYRKSKLPITKQLRRYKTWSPEAVEHRQEWMAKLAVRVWPRS
jgi:hypothetical protein